MEKEDVLLEIVNEEDFEEVSIIPYDLNTNTIISAPIETISRSEAIDRYRVVGEIVFGEIRLYDNYCEEDDNYDYNLEIEEE